MIVVEELEAVGLPAWPGISLKGSESVVGIATLLLGC